MEDNRPVGATMSHNDAAPQETITPEISKVNPQDESFARKERQIRQMQKALQAEKAAWQKERQTQEQEYKTNYISKNRVKEDPLSVLSEAGISMEELNTILMNAPNSNDPTVRALRAEMKAIKDAQAAQQTATEQAQNQQYEQAVKQIGNEAKLLIDSDPEFETIKGEGMHEAVVELIVETWNTENRLMDVREAALEVENYLVDQGVKFSKYGKVQAKQKPVNTAAQTPAEQKTPAKKQEPVSVQLKTLTNSMPTSPSKKTAEAERKARAIAAFQGKLSG